ncbi:MAG: hypothetical protein ACLP4R_01790 [Solirubrobacteraceae bacterium]
MNRYRVDVVASYPLDADILGAFARAPKTPAGIPSFETTALDWIVEESVMIPPLRQTLTVPYEVEGRNEDEARQFALAIFEQERRRVPLPDAETVVANLSDD